MFIETFAFQAVQPKAGTPGVAQESAAAAGAGGGASAPSAGGSFMMIAPMLLLMVPILWMSSRKQKKEEQARASLKKGDRVMSQSGLIGKLLEMDERVAKVEIAPGVKVEMVASSLSPVEVAAEKKADKGDGLKDLKDAKVAAEKK